MSNFSKCIKAKLPWSLLLYPCAPCHDNHPFIKIYFVGLIPIIFYLIIKFIYRNHKPVFDWLQFDRSIPIYMTLISSLLIALSSSIYLYQRQIKINPKKKYNWFSYFLSSLCIGILTFISGVVSIHITEYLPYLPLIGGLLYSIYNKFADWIGINTIKIMQGFYGSGLSALAMLIPTIGPLITVISMLLPQNLLLIWLSYSIICASFGL